jgi:hypothetical protein
MFWDKFVRAEVEKSDSLGIRSTEMGILYV